MTTDKQNSKSNSNSESANNVTKDASSPSKIESNTTNLALSNTKITTKKYKDDTASKHKNFQNSRPAAPRLQRLSPRGR